MEQKSKRYIIGLDFIRIIAMILVVTVHSTTFNDWELTKNDISVVNIIASFIRYLSFCCVPLFVMLTGYLNKGKTISLNYYKKIIRVLIEYVICSILVGLFRVFYLGDVFTVFAFFRELVSFSLAEYTWYINMYIGLFLLIPFLNVLYNNLPSKKIKTIFLAVLIIIFALPETTGLCTWNYWIKAYPVMFYYIGCYLREFDLNIKKSYAVLIILFTLMCQTAISVFSIPSMHMDNHINLFCVIVSVLIFRLLQNVESPKINVGSKILRTISNSSLAFFLVSYIFEQIFLHEIFVANGLMTYYDRFQHLLWTVPCTIILSIITAVLINYITGLLTKLLGFITKNKICV